MSKACSPLNSGDLPGGRQKAKNAFTALFANRTDLPQAIASSQKEYFPLPDDYQPSEFDVICGRGRGNYNAPGNRLFRQIVTANADKYMRHACKTTKTAVLAMIADRVRAQNHGNCHFVKQQKDGSWVALGDAATHEKVGHAMREALASRGRRRQHKERTSNKKKVPPTAATAAMISEKKESQPVLILQSNKMKPPSLTQPTVAGRLYFNQHRSTIRTAGRQTRTRNRSVDSSTDLECKPLAIRKLKSCDGVHELRSTGSTQQTELFGGLLDEYSPPPSLSTLKSSKCTSIADPLEFPNPNPTDVSWMGLGAPHSTLEFDGELMWSQQW